MERAENIEKIVDLLKDYRSGEIAQIGSDRVEKWINQFDGGDQDVVLSETFHLLHQTYISRSACVKFLSTMITCEKLTGGSAEFWDNTSFLDLQVVGSSQKHMLSLAEDVMKKIVGRTINKSAPKTNTYIYLDDVSCTGARVFYDIVRWLNAADIKDSQLHVVTLVTFTGQHHYRERLDASLKKRGCKIAYWHARMFENRLSAAKNSEIFWPTHLPDETHVNKWVASLGDKAVLLKPRPSGGVGSTSLFSSEASREVIEQAFLRKGAYLVPLLNKASLRPLGFTALTTTGFGMVAVTYRNCPNNAPLALWAGAPWTPLLERRTN